MVLLVAVVVGGKGSTWGAPLGVAALVLLIEGVSIFSRYEILAYGIVLTLALTFVPRGIAGLVGDLRSSMVARKSSAPVGRTGRHGRRVPKGGFMETSEIVIRRPTAKFRPKESAPVFDLGKPIRGMRVGIRTDAFWRSWLDVADEWVEQLRRDGAEPVLVKVGEHTGEEGQYTKDILEAWADSVDCAVVGLAN